MMRSFAAGLLVLLLLAVAAFLTKNPALFQTGALLLGLAGFVGAGLLSGAFADGAPSRSTAMIRTNRMRTHLANEDKQD